MLCDGGSQLAVSRSESGFNFLATLGEFPLFCVKKFALMRVQWHAVVQQLMQINLVRNGIVANERDPTRDHNAQSSSYHRRKE